MTGERELKLLADDMHPLAKLAQQARAMMIAIDEGIRSVEHKGFFDLEMQLAAKNALDNLEKLEQTVILTAYENGLLTFRSQDGSETT